jgi:uncharacterized damage-inducible protein DinB
VSHLVSVERRFNALLCLPKRLGGVPWGLDTLGIMPPPLLRPPDAGEFAPFFARYVERVAHVADPVGELDAQRMRVLALLEPLSDEEASFRYAQGKWSIKALVGHLADADRILSYRLLRIGRGDETPLAGWDEEAYARTAGFDDRRWRELLDDWTAARDSTIALVRGMPDEAWDRRGLANNGPATTRALLYIILGHVEHHLAVLRERYGL